MPTEEPVEIVVGRGGTVEGSVARGQGVAAMLVLRRVGGDGSETVSVSRDASGAFTATGLRPGTYELRLTTWEPGPTRPTVRPTADTGVAEFLGTVEVREGKTTRFER